MGTDDPAHTVDPAGGDPGATPRWIVALSGVICLVIAVLILGPRPDGVAGTVDVSRLPWVNATLNGITTVLLLAGYGAMRAQRIPLHRALMTSALGCSALFLCSYVVHHWFSAGPTTYDGPFRPLYLIVLLTHIVLAALILPAAMTTWFRGWTGRVAAHRRIAPTTLGVWLYVSISGVLITLMAHG
jgi:putative membrane protein